MIASLLGDSRAGRLRWVLVSLPIGIWVVHLTFVTAMVHYTCSHPGWRWTLYAGTVIPAAIVVGAIALALVCVRQAAGADPGGPSREDQLAFLAHLAVAIGVLNLILIVAEGIVIPFLSSCA